MISNVPISITLTTCGRSDLLKTTLNSFLNTNTYPIDEFLIINDLPDEKINIDDFIEDSCILKNTKLIQNEKRRGQLRSLDILFNSCKNEYIFHLEDDWLFTHSNNYIKNSLSILEFDSNIHQVHIRHQNDTPHKAIGEILSIKDVFYLNMEPNFMQIWNGFSWNPGLRRKSDYLKMFPNGYSEFKDELECSLYSRKFSYKAVTLADTACKHIGYDRTTNPHLTHVYGK